MIVLLSTLFLLGPAVGAEPNASEPPVREGAYAMVVDVGSRSKVPVAGTTEVTTRSLVRLTLSRTESGWQQRQDLCAVDIRSDTRAETVLPPAFIRAVPTETYPVQLERSEAGWRYRADPGPQHIGYDPKVTGGEVPESRSDPGVLDHEGDGHPGATVLLKVPVLGAVRMYIAQKGWSRYQGQVRPDGSIQGTVEVVATEQRTLGASVSLFAANPSIESVPSRSRFRIVALESAETCASLAARWGGRFELEPR